MKKTTSEVMDRATNEASRKQFRQPKWNATTKQRGRLSLGVPFAALVMASFVALVGCGGGGNGGKKNDTTATPAPSSVSPATDPSPGVSASSPLPTPIATAFPTPAPPFPTPSGPTPIATPTPTPVPVPIPTPVPTPAPGSFTVAAQFNPRNYTGNGSLTTTSGDTYRFDTGAASAPTLTDTTTNTLVATGQYVTQSFGSARASVTYAVFAFSGDIRIGGKSSLVGRGKNPLVLLSRGDIILNEGAVLDVSADGTLPGSLTYPLTTIPGAGGGEPDQGPGTGGTSTKPNGSNTDYYYGGAGFGGRGGVPSTTYGEDFAGGSGTQPHLQGGSGGKSSYVTGGPSGGAVYLGALGTLTVQDALIKALGGHGSTGGSGGGVALFGGKGVNLASQTVVVNVSGGSAGSFMGAPSPIGDGHFYGGGGGGRVVIGYPVGSARPPALSVAIGGNGVGNQDGMRNGEDGVIVVGQFAGF